MVQSPALLNNCEFQWEYLPNLWSFHDKFRSNRYWLHNSSCFFACYYEFYFTCFQILCWNMYDNTCYCSLLITKILVHDDLWFWDLDDTVLITTDTLSFFMVQWFYEFSSLIISFFIVKGFLGFFLYSSMIYWFLLVSTILLSTDVCWNLTNFTYTSLVLAEFELAISWSCCA